MQPQYPEDAFAPLVQADRLLTEAWEALREYRKDLAPEHAEMVDALLGAVVVTGFPITYLLADSPEQD